VVAFIRGGVVPNCEIMLDVIYIGTAVLFFVAGEIYAHWCEKL
jgi:hypothetical protein